MVVHHWSDDGMVMYHRRSLVASVFVLALYLFSTCICRACLPDQLTSITPIPSRALSPCKTDRGWKQCEEIICKSHAHTIHINIYVKLRYMWRSVWKSQSVLPMVWSRFLAVWLSLVHFMSFRKTCHKNVPPTSWQVILSRASVAEKKKENKNFLECKVI